MKKPKKQALVKRGKRLPVKTHVKAALVSKNFKVEIDGVTVG
jgi:hypothetical protein